MVIKTIVVGDLDTNCYLLIKNSHILVIDPGAEFNKIDSQIDNLNIDGILITHNHFDHIGALDEIKEKYKVKSYDKNNFKEKEYKIGEFTFNVIYTKGHTNDSITYYFKEENIMFVGDFIFKNNIGRTDLHTGSYKEMIKSIEKIKTYPNVKIYPGHGEFTYLSKEKQENYYFI